MIRIGQFMADAPRGPHQAFKKFPMVAHHEVGETFADQIGTVTFDGATLRIELAVARMNEPTPGAQPTGERHLVCRLVLSAPCAVDLINQMQTIANQLAAAGLIKTEPPKPAQSPQSVAKN
jgi:hypothetical protein